MLALALLLAAVEVTGDVTCPSPADVAARLQPLVPSAGSASDAYRVRLVRAGDALVVEMSDGAGAKLAERRLGTGAACADLASAAAVVIATWEVELRGQGTLSLYLPEPRPVTAPSSRLWIGAGGYGAGVPQSTSFAADVELALARDGGAVAGLLDLMFIGDHRATLAPGAARWRRFALGLGGRVGTGGRAWEVAASAAALVSLLAIHGQGFDADRGDTALDPGGDLGVRVAWKAGRVRPWVGAHLLAWPVSRTLRLEGATSTYDVPRWEALVGAGAVFSVRP